MVSPSADKHATYATLAICEDIAAIPAAERSNWILQEKIVYEPGIKMPTGEGVKAEVRMMFLRAPDEAKDKKIEELEAKVNQLLEALTRPAGQAEKA